MKKIIHILSIFLVMVVYSDTETVDGVTWTYWVDKNGNVTIQSETGYESGAIPSSTKGAISVPKMLGGHPVTSIGSYAFYCRSGVTSVSIPEGVTSVGFKSFYGCSNLISVSMPNSVTNIGDSAFESCYCLSSISIPAGLTSIGNRTFYYCRELTSLQIPSSVTRIGSHAFESCSKLESVGVADGITNIGAYAFNYCKVLKSFSLPKSVSSIGEGAFQYCEGLPSIVVPNAVTILNDFVFQYCKGLKSVRLSENLELIGKWVFDGCSNIETISIPGSFVVSGVFPAAYKNITQASITTGSTYAVARMFEGCTNLRSVIVPEGVLEIRSMAFYKCNLLESVSWPESLVSIGSAAFYCCHSLKSVSLSPNVKSIREEAFYQCQQITSAIIPDGVESISSCLFCGCTKLENVKIPDGVVLIGSSAFDGCSKLKSVNIPLTVGRIYQNAFRGCGALGQGVLVVDGCVLGVNGECPAEIIFPSGVRIIADGAFNAENNSNCKSLRSLRIPEGIDSIGDCTFTKCEGLESVYIPNSVTNISSYNVCAFGGCKKIREIKVPGNYSIKVVFPDAYTNIQSAVVNEGVQSILASAFSDCTSLLSVSLPNGLVEIGAGAFRKCKSLSSITIPNSVENIGTCAFYSCQRLSSVIIPNSVIFVGADAFYDCNNIVSVTCPGRFKLRSIFPYSYTGIIDVRVAEGSELIVDNAFEGCKKAKSISIPDSVMEIGSGAFADNDLLFSEGVMIQDGCVLGYKGECPAVIELPDNVRLIANGAFSNCSVLNEILMRVGVIKIGAKAFYGCSGLINVVLPDTVVSIGKEAFSGCRGISSVILPKSIRQLNDGVFQNCSNITAIDIPDGVTKIGSYSFKNCCNLKSLALPLSVVEIGQESFSGCQGLGSVNIPNGIESLYVRAFYGCNNITNAVVPGSWVMSSEFSDSYQQLEVVTVADGATQVAANAFKGCSRLLSVSIPGSVVSIGKNAFNGCTSLGEVLIPNSVRSIGESAFFNCSGITAMKVPSRVESIGINAFIGTRLYDVYFEGYPPAMSVGAIPSYSTIHYRKEYFREWEPMILSLGNVAKDDVIIQVPPPVITPSDGASFSSDNCFVELTCGANDATLYCRIGAKPKATSTYVYSGPISISETSTIYAFAIKDGVSSEMVSATITKVTSERIAVAVDALGVDMFVLGAKNGWVPIISAGSKVGTMCAKSGRIGDGQQSRLEATVSGAGTLTFYWKSSCEEDELQDFDHLEFIVDGEEFARIDGETGWTPVTVELEDVGRPHELAWVYVKDESENEGEDCGWIDGVVWSKRSASMGAPTVEGDEGATMTGDAETGFVIKPSDGNTAVEVTIPQGVDAAKVTVEVSPKVATVKPNGAKVKVVVGENDITGHLVIPESDGVMNVAAATVKEEIVKETLDPSKDAVIELNAANPKLITAPTRKGLTYTLFEGRAVKSLSKGDSKLGDGDPWKPTITVSGGDAAFFSIGVSK